MITNETTILVADDNEEILFVLGDNLKENYQVLMARNGVEALELLAQNNVHLIITDIMMPRMDGYRLCEAIKSNYEFSHIPTIMLTAKNTIRSKIEGLNVGADVYIEKPFSMEFLLAQVQSLLVNRAKLKSYYVKSPTADMASIAVNETEKSFLQKLEYHIAENMAEHDLDVQHLARYMNMSRTSLYRKISSISSLAPSEIINLTRVKKAIELLQTQDLRLNEITDIVGYSSVTQLGRNFQKFFGLTPTEYIKKHIAR